MKIKAFLLFFLFIIFLPIISLAQGDFEQEEEIFKAEVIEIINQDSSSSDDGLISVHQKIKLEGLEKNWEGKEIIFDGTKFDVLSAPEYKVGDKVLVNRSFGPGGEENFYIIGFSRTGPVYLLAFLFFLVVILVSGRKGFRALLVLVLTFLVILEFIIPEILSGKDPLVASIIGSLFILLVAVYITEGLTRKSTIAIIAIMISLTITGLLSLWFSNLVKLTGFASEEAVYIIELVGGSVSIKGLLLAGIIIGALGVLDDVVISQVALVDELTMTNPEMKRKEIYSQAMRVGISHLSSMVNTLFLAYAGASLPLLILFSIKQPPFLTFSQVMDNEIIATEIVRTFTGSIGLVLAIPIATFLAVKFIKIK
jgi:uncharacterized membrane protein